MLTEFVCTVIFLNCDVNLEKKRYTSKKTGAKEMQRKARVLLTHKIPDK